MRTQKPCAMPVIDLSARVMVIDDTGAAPKWRLVETVPAASVANARRVMKKHGLTSAWLVDALGGKQFVTG